MRVRISYTTDLDDIPQELVRLLGSCAYRILESGEITRRISTHTYDKEDMDPNMVEVINRVRAQLAKADSVLADCVNIVQGFINTSEQMENPTEEAPIPEGAPNVGV